MATSRGEVRNIHLSIPDIPGRIIQSEYDAMMGEENMTTVGQI
jgi:hypothetical protein